MKKIVLLCFLFTAFCFNAQEGLRPLTGNINYIYHDLIKTELQPKGTSVEKRASIQIPFKEDFYYAYKQSYPDQNLWSDSSTYINTGHAIAPPSIGVATFDGLNKHGYPYNPTLQNMLASLPADTLTSRPINLFTTGTQTLLPTSNVALKFHYQARGRGEAPEQIDSLLVDFFKPKQNTWDKKVWFKRGNNNSNTNDTLFKKGFIWIKDTAYLHDGFKFRFRNKATTAGDFDHWHVDYIHLKIVNDSLGDSTYNDMAIGYVPTPFLKNYSAMPWQQYVPEENGNSSVFIRNNGILSSLSLTYKTEFILPDNTIVNTFSATASNAQNPDYFNSSGWSVYPPHVNPAAQATFTNPFTAPADSIDYRVRHTLSTGTGTNSNEEWTGNDTVIQTQQFRNYFAFDDGSAEGGYYINGTGGKMTVKIGLNATDTLRSLRLYFDPVGNMSIQQNTMGLATSSYSFRIIIYNNAGIMPGSLILRDSLMPVRYYTKSGFNATPEYKLTTPVILGPGTYYVGIQQFVASGITVGFDKNINHNQNLYYDSGNGWNQSSIYGSLMVRPVFGKKVLPPVSVNENSSAHALTADVFPNPANSDLKIVLHENINANYRLVNLVGQTVAEDNFLGSVYLNTENIAEGLYLLCIKSGTKLENRKVIIKH